jgi:hypothetical protein
MAGFLTIERLPGHSPLILVDNFVPPRDLVAEHAAYEGYAVATENTREHGLRMAKTSSFRPVHPLPAPASLDHLSTISVLTDAV